MGVIKLAVSAAKAARRPKTAQGYRGPQSRAIGFNKLLEEEAKQEVAIEWKEGKCPICNKVQRLPIDHEVHCIRCTSIILAREWTYEAVLIEYIYPPLKPAVGGGFIYGNKIVRDKGQQ